MSLTRLQRPALLALAGALTIGALGCADDAEPERADTESIGTTNDDAGTDTTAAEDGAGEAETTDETAAQGPGGGEVLGTARTQLRANPNNDTQVPLRADVTRLEHHEGVVEVTIALTNENPAGVGDGGTFEPYSLFEDPEAMGAYDASGIGLVDAAGQKLYLPALDSEGNCLCTGDLAATAVPPADTMILSATIGGVPDDLEQVDVTIPGFPSIVGLTIQ